VVSRWSILLASNTRTRDLQPENVSIGFGGDRNILRLCLKTLPAAEKLVPVAYAGVGKLGLLQWLVELG
jgi:hypothetical protein